MPPYFPKPLPIPRPQKLFIYSQFTLNKSLKNYLKHLKCLKIETKPSIFISSQTLSKSRLKALQRRAKALKLLDLEKHKQLFESKVPQALSILKSCKNISSLTLFESLTPKGFLLDRRWLTFGYLPDPSHDNDVCRSQNSLLLKSHLIRRHKRPKLIPPDYAQALEILFSRFKSPPSTFNKLLNSPKSLLTKFRSNFIHLYFELYYFTLPLPFDALLYIINRLPNPSKIIHLAAFALNVFDQNDTYASQLQTALNHLQSPRSLNLGIHSFFPLSKSLKTPSSLLELRLSLPIQKREELIELALSIASFQNLSLLAIVNTKSIQGYAGKGHRIFFSQISGLSQLKSLEINLCGESIDSLKPQLFYGCLEEFAGCVERLHELQEITFTQSEFSIAPEFDSLADALKKKGSRLQKLKIKFMNGQKKIDHLKKLNKALKTMGNLEELSLENLCAEKESLIHFGEVISDLKWVRSIKLHGEDPNLEQADLVKTLKKTLMKYGLEELEWFCGRQIYEMNYFSGNGIDSIDIKEVILRNPRLYSVRLDCSRAESKSLVFKNLKGFLP